MELTKRQILPPGLWVVATPIGNLQDLTARARQALDEAEIILCEDTRRTRNLFSGISLSVRGKTIARFDAHTEKKDLSHWIDLLRQGKAMALVTDAGTPSISDQGAHLVRTVWESGGRVIPVPGVSAVTALLSISGFEAQSFTFRGFFPRESRNKKEELQKVSQYESHHVVSWFESPLRILETLHCLVEFDPSLNLIVAKELTKLHEAVFRGTSEQVTALVKQEVEKNGEIGEWCFAAEFTKEPSEPQSSNIDLHIAPLGAAHLALECLIAAGISVSESAIVVSQRFGISRKHVYRAALKLTQKKDEEGG